MAYCRWSSDGYQCDLYVYESIGDVFITHVAARRRPKKIPDIELGGDVDALMASVKRHHDAANDPHNAPQPIGLRHDGETFEDATLADLRDRLVYLRRAGYQFPDYVLEDIDAELSEDET